MATETIRILIVDDHPVVREGVASLLREFEGVEVVGQAGSGAEAVEMHGRLGPEVTLMDVRLPGQDGIQTLAAIREVSPQARVIMLASEAFPHDVLRARKGGAAGFLLKTASHEELMEAIRQVHRKGWCEPFEPGARPPEEKQVSARELEVLDFIRRGFSNPDISVALGITEHTVKMHVKAIFAKLDCMDRTEAVVAAYERGLFRLSK